MWSENSHLGRVERNDFIPNIVMVFVWNFYLIFKCCYIIFDSVEFVTITWGHEEENNWVQTEIDWCFTFWNVFVIVFKQTNTNEWHFNIFDQVIKCSEAMTLAFSVNLLENVHWICAQMSCCWVDDNKKKKYFATENNSATEWQK